MAGQIKRLLPSEQEFHFSKENKIRVEKILSKYPEERKKSATMPLLYLAQEQNGGWLSKEAIEEIAQILELPSIRVYEVASFYSMYFLAPVGKHVIQVCGTTPCQLRGAEEIVDLCKKRLGIDLGGTSKDGMFTLLEVECLGACSSAPVMQINNDYYEDLEPNDAIEIIDDLASGREVKIGSQKGRKSPKPAKLEW